MVAKPSKKTLSVLILTAALVFSIILAFGREKSSNTINYTNNLVAGEKIVLKENPDWQVELKNSSPTNELIPADTTASSETNTDVISRSLMANYLSLKQKGALDKSSAEKLIDQTLSLVEQLGVKATLNENLTIIPDNGAFTIRDYGENLGNILRGKKVKDLNRELSLAVKVVSQNDKASAEELKIVIAKYEEIKNNLVKMPVPQTFVKAHLDITNSVNGIAISLKELLDTQNDPFKGFSALQLYQKSITTLSQAMQATVYFINKNNIVYKQGSGGYYLLYEI